MSALIDFLSQSVYWIAKLYFMGMGIVYILALLGRFDMGLFTNITGIIGVLFLISNLYWHFMRK